MSNFVAIHLFKFFVRPLNINSSHMKKMSIANNFANKYPGFWVILSTKNRTKTTTNITKRTRLIDTAFFDTAASFDTVSVAIANVVTYCLSRLICRLPYSHCTFRGIVNRRLLATLACPSTFDLLCNCNWNFSNSVIAALLLLCKNIIMLSHIKYRKSTMHQRH